MTDAGWLKDLGLGGEAIFALLCLMFVLQITKLLMDYTRAQRKEGGATHDDIMKLCYAILEKLEHK